MPDVHFAFPRGDSLSDRLRSQHCLNYDRYDGCNNAPGIMLRYLYNSWVVSSVVSVLAVVTAEFF